VELPYPRSLWSSHLTSLGIEFVPLRRCLVGRSAARQFTAPPLSLRVFSLPIARTILIQTQPPSSSPWSRSSWARWLAMKTAFLGPCCRISKVAARQMSVSFTVPLPVAGKCTAPMVAWVLTADPVHFQCKRVGDECKMRHGCEPPQTPCCSRCCCKQRGRRARLAPREGIAGAAFKLSNAESLHDGDSSP
jgi:hypothetical protein